MTNKQREDYARYLSRLTIQELGEEWDSVTEDILRKAHKKRKTNDKIVIEYPWVKKQEETPSKKVLKVRKKKKHKPSLCAKKKGKKKCKRFIPPVPGRKRNN
jgi:hypothetical protein|uniref:Uncharacterized protein n=1 Tax=Myoviridae sp. ctgXL3 TaxID=2826681 RepID=A0A8S5QRW8_9CAUD|nr:MAG TPA: hypothetical protein [Myoviridae sp. ctgXL3]